MASLAAGDERHREDQCPGPEAEDDFHLAEKVEGARMPRVAVGHQIERLGGKRMENRDGEKHR
jgi:hypothetical protein